MQNPKEPAPVNASGFAIRFLDFGDDESVTKEKVDELIQLIRKNDDEYPLSCCLSLDEYGEDSDDFLSVDIEDGWAALALNTWDEDGDAHLYQPINPAYETSDEEAPVCIGGQTPVLMRNALNNPNLTAECVLHFAKTGQLYPGIQWEELK